MKTIRARERRSWELAVDPGLLFIAWWKLASDWGPADCAMLPKPAVAIRDQLTAAVAVDNGRLAVASILEAIGAAWPAGDGDGERMEIAGLILQAMRAIDDAFTPLHPRTRVLSATFGAPPRKPGWLASAERRRSRHGDFGARADRRLIPNGPFSRHARGRAASSANVLQDQFPILTVAPTEGRHGDRTILIAMKVIATDVMRGVAGSPSIGHERVRFIPLAEEAGDLEFKHAVRSTQATLDVRPVVDTAARLLTGLRDGGDIDLAFAPELTVRGVDDNVIETGIAALAENAPRIILAGSGLTADVDGLERPWNEARILARGGHVLWEQRKIWPYGMSQGQAVGFGFPDPGADETLMEDVAGHSLLTVVDLDGFGRCIVLICQDLQATLVVDEIVERYQPDWVLTPVLDRGVDISGWAHQRALGLSKKAQARYVVGSSLTLSRLRNDVLEPPVGLAVGPAEPTKGSSGSPAQRRSVAVVRAIAGPTPRVGLLVWDDSSVVWKASSVTATPAAKSGRRRV